jgi:hypothetical protein
MKNYLHLVSNGRGFNSGQLTLRLRSERSVALSVVVRFKSKRTI